MATMALFRTEQRREAQLRSDHIILTLPTVRSAVIPALQLIPLFPPMLPAAGEDWGSEIPGCWGKGSQIQT